MSGALSAPTGRGCFVRQVRGEAGRKQLVSDMRRAGMTWACLLALWQREPGAKDLRPSGLEETATALRHAGIQTWVWGWPLPGREQAFLAELREAVEATQARGLIVDAERPYYGQLVEAQTLAAQMIAARDADIGIGFTSYGQAQMHPRFPWAPFGGLGVGIPQCYLWAAQHPGSTVKAIKAWSRLGWDVVVPALPSWGLTSPELRRQLTETEECAAVIAWDWANGRARPDLWRVLGA